MSSSFSLWDVTLDCGCVVNLRAVPSIDYNYGSGEWINYGYEPIDGELTTTCATHTPTEKGTPNP